MLKSSPMSASAFDTLAYTKRLRAAGVPEAQAEAQAEALAAAITSELVTKHDLSEAVLKLEGKMNVMQWMLGFIVALVVTILFRVFT